MKNLEKITLWFSVATIVVMALHFGPGNQHLILAETVFKVYLLLYSSFLTFVGIKRILLPEITVPVRIFNVLISVMSAITGFALLLNLTMGINMLAEGLIFGFTILQVFIGVSRELTATLHSRLHPALVFVLSFAILILFGALMLMLPGSTVKGITFLQALFTSTSAVSVTGLAVLDTGKEFTVFGQSIILILIQLGGLGVLTFSNLFALLFSGGGSFRDQIAMTDFINSENLGSTQRLLLKIIVFVLAVELSGALLIYISISDTVIADDKIFFSLFHAVSAFCNAGFSTLSNSLYETDVRFNYPLHLIISFLIIFGGLGYNISINYTSYLKSYFSVLWRRLTKSGEPHLFPKHIIRINTIIVVQATLALLLLGWLMFFVLEYNNTLKEHESIWGKLVVSFFNAVTPRTAGFNNVDMAAMLNPTIIVFILLMWIGASPGSTGGGIKTTTFAVAVMNLKNQVLGKERLEFRHREIPMQATQRASVIIILSLIAIGTSIFLLSVFEPKMDVIKLTFETFSAFCTVGLTLGITYELSDASRILLIIVMFLGRVSLLTFIVAVMRQFYEPKQSRYQYPKEDIFIN